MIDGPESTVNWRDVVQTLLLLDWSPEGLSSRHDLRKKVEKEPSEFAALLQEVSQMVHLQLRLSSSRVAEDACRAACQGDATLCAGLILRRRSSDIMSRLIDVGNISPRHLCAIMTIVWYHTRKYIYIILNLSL